MLVIRKLQINAHLALCIIYELAAKKIGSKARHFVLTLGKLVDLCLILAKLLVSFWYQLPLCILSVLDYNIVIVANTICKILILAKK